MGVELFFELLEGFEEATAVELVLHMSEESFHRGVVEAGCLPRHALCRPQIPKALLVRELLILPSLIGVQEGWT